MQPVKKLLRSGPQKPGLPSLLLISYPKVISCRSPSTGVLFSAKVGSFSLLFRMTSSLSPRNAHGTLECLEWPRAWPPTRTSTWTDEARDRRHWDPFLAACQQMAQARGVPQILSLSQPIPELDPLAVLAQRLGSLPTNRFPSYCYLSHKAHGERVRVLGWGSLRQVDLAGEGGLRAARIFVEELQPHVHTACVGRMEPSEVGGSPGSRQERPLCFCRLSFSPRSKGGAALVLPRWQLLQVPDSWRSLAVARLNLEIDPESDLAALAGQITAFFAQMERLSRSPLPSWELQAPVPVNLEEAPLLARIQKALQVIQAGSLEKVVLAEAVDLHLPASPSIPPLLAYLEKHHPDCSIFAFAAGVSGPKSLEADARGNLPARPLPLVQEGAFPQVFLGATPERLLSVWQGRVQIDALAGSAARGATSHQDQVLAERLLCSAKDRREHEWVVRSIQEALGRLGMDPCISPQPRLLRLANIQHLQTLIEAELPADVHLFDLLAQLHPTAAVGGYPQQAALQWLERLEPFDRSSYAAPLGWVDLQGNGEFVVGIRSALIRGNWARLYAGAGIVADSNPEQELAEIRLKLRSLVQALALRPAAPPLPSF